MCAYYYCSFPSVSVYANGNKHGGAVRVGRPEGVSVCLLPFFPSVSVYANGNKHRGAECAGRPEWCVCVYCAYSFFPCVSVCVCVCVCVRAYLSIVFVCACLPFYFFLCVRAYLSIFVCVRAYLSIFHYVGLARVVYM